MIDFSLRTQVHIIFMPVFTGWLTIYGLTFNDSILLSNLRLSKNVRNGIRGSIVSPPSRQANHY